MFELIWYGFIYFVGFCSGFFIASMLYRVKVLERLLTSKEEREK